MDTLDLLVKICISVSVLGLGKSIIACMPLYGLTCLLPASETRLACTSLVGVCLYTVEFNFFVRNPCVVH